MTELENSLDFEQQLEQLLSLSEELQEENGNLRQQLSSKDYQIQTLSSDKQKLSEQVRKQMSQMQQQAEQIEKLCNSDKELKRSEELEKQSREREKLINSQLKKSQEEVALFKRKYQKLADEAKQKIERADQAADKSEQLKKDQKSYIEKAAEEKYTQLKSLYLGLVIAVGIYAFTVTLFTAFKSKRCISDCRTIFETFQKEITFYVDKLFKLAASLADVSTGIGQETVLIIVHWLIYTLIVLVGAALPLTAVYFGGKGIVGVYRQCCADEISVLVALISLAIVIFFAELMPLNVLLLLIISHVIYIFIRWFIHGYREARGL